MSGIAGIYYLDGCGVRPQDLRRMIQTTWQEGTLTVNIMTDGCAGLAHRAAPVIPQWRGGSDGFSAGPEWLSATANVRIDNRDDVIEKLGLNSGARRTLSDALLLVRAYERWGEHCVDHILGDFAFAIWDARKQELFCARDHLGLRPLYYTYSNSVFAFASEIKALLALHEVSRCLNESRVADHLMQMTEDKEATFYKDILRVPPAHTLVVCRDGIRLRQYWTLDEHREIRLGSDDAYASTFRQLFVRSVDDRLEGLSSLGSLLSGGLDSSSVTCTAKALLQADDDCPLKTFSLVFDDVPKSDERGFIKAVLKEGGLLPHFIRGDQINPFEDLDRMLTHLDEPFFTPNLFLSWQLWKHGGDQGIRVMLDGFLGDNVVCHGSRYLTELATNGNWLTLAREIHTITKGDENQRIAAWHILKRFAVAPLMIEPIRHFRNRFRSPDWSPMIGWGFVNRDFAHRIHWRERAQAFGEEAPRIARSTRKEQYRELSSGALPTALEIAYKSASAFGVEPRFPFSDRRLMEFCLAIPPTQKYSDGMTRMITRRALKEYLPDQIRLRRDKGTLGPNFTRSLMVLARDEMEGHVFEELPLASPYLNVSAIQEAYLQLRDRPRSEALLPIWLSIVLTRWLKRQRYATVKYDNVSSFRSEVTRNSNYTAGWYHNQCSTVT